MGNLSKLRKDLDESESVPVSGPRVKTPRVKVHTRRRMGVDFLRRGGPEGVALGQEWMLAVYFEPEVHVPQRGM